ncbi:hypothetical protein, variant 5 [Aphanomyces invadans]|uniref:Uncharacterized protein n=1 Tax=Aphanomyces invadans TaxID=157072 RepID=A0A024UK20_9STRA|nr:hypothetical protein, variant 5 [Aphanomyces invadans]ETW05933.1 hypothetical protein, variant 5 [Aphanomyces invadans]|eukprot:XP_008865710.1 hypothetical protein, variant 5 [Aphanomyces invadans]
MMREFRRFLFREKMSWLSSSLQLAGELLESVDQKASGKLKPRGEDRKKPKTVSEEAWEVKHTSSGGYEDSTHHNLHVSTEFETPSHSSSSAHQAAPASPSNGGPDADSFSEWSEVDNESNSGLVMYDEPPLSSSSSKSHQLPPLPAEMQSMKSETQRLRRENAKLRNDLSSVERQLTNSTEQLSVCQEELEALDKECMDKIKCLEQQIAQMGREKAADEAQFVAALGVKDAHVHTLEADLASYKQLVQEHVAEAAKLKQSIEELTNTREEAWTHAASGEAQLLQQVASLQEELKDAAVAHAQLKKEYADAKQSIRKARTQRKTVGPKPDARTPCPSGSTGNPGVDEEVAPRRMPQSDAASPRNPQVDGRYGSATDYAGAKGSVPSRDRVELAAATAGPCCVAVEADPFCAVDGGGGT